MNTVITSKMIEADLESVWNIINEHDYAIKSSGEIIYSIVKGLLHYYIIHVFVAFSCHYQSPSFIGLDDAIFGSVIAALGITLLVVAFFYVPVSIFLSLNDGIKGQSLVINIALKKFRFFRVLLFSVVLIASLFNAFVVKGDLSIFFPAFAMFVCGILLALCYKLSMMRYLTPGAIKILSKINLFVSGKNG